MGGGDVRGRGVGRMEWSGGGNGTTVIASSINILKKKIRESSDSHSQRGTRTSALSFPGRSSVPLEILQNSPFTRRHPELEMTGTSGRRDQWVKEISCCWPTWPLLSCIPDNRVSACAHMCVCALRVSGKRQTARQNKAILLSCYFYITFSVTFQ